MDPKFYSFTRYIISVYIIMETDEEIENRNKGQFGLHSIIEP